MFRYVRTAMRYVAVFFILAAFVIGIMNALAPKTHSQQPRPKNTLLAQNNALQELVANDPVMNKDPAMKLVMTLYRTQSCQLIGQNCKDEAGQQNSILYRGSQVMSYAYMHPPASGTYESYRVLSNAGLVSKSYAAQGVGFAALEGYRPLWKVFRDISFGILVLMMVIMAFLVMFRFKMGAQTSISIESALPRVVFSLLLISFSYAIAGFLIDAMYVLMGITITALCHNGDYCNAAITVDKYLNAGAGTIFTSFFSGNLWTLANSLLSLLPNVIMGIVYAVGTGVNIFVTGYIMALLKSGGFIEALNGIQLFFVSLGHLPGGLIGWSAFGIIFAVLSFATVPAIMVIAIFLTILTLFFRIYFMLLFTYLRILLLVTFAPLFMLMEVIPGRNSFSFWIKSLIGELITFPVVAALFVIGSIIVNNFHDPLQESASATWWQASGWQPPFLLGVETQSFMMVAGMGILFLIPDIVKMVKEAIGTKGIGLNFGIGTFMAGAGVGFAGGAGLLGKGMALQNTLMHGGILNKDQGLSGVINRFKGTLGGPLRGQPGGVVSQNMPPATNDPDKLTGFYRNTAREAAKKKLLADWQQQPIMNRPSLIVGKGRQELNKETDRIAREMADKQLADQARNNAPAATQPSTPPPPAPANTPPPSNSNQGSSSGGTSGTP